MVHTFIATACISAACAAFGGVLAASAAASPGDARFTHYAPLPNAPGPNIPGPGIPGPNLDVPNVPGNINTPGIPGNVNVDIADEVVDLVPGIQAPDDFVDLVPNIPEVKVPNVNVPNIGGGGRRR